MKSSFLNNSLSNELRCDWSSTYVANWVCLRPLTFVSFQMQVMRHNRDSRLTHISPASLCASAFVVCSGFVGIRIHITDLFNI